MKIIARKNGGADGLLLWVWVAHAGAELPLCEALSHYGHNLGVAFQIADDVLDMVGEETAVGKSLGTDLLRRRKATLPLIRLLDTVDPSERSEIPRCSLDPATITATSCGPGSAAQRNCLRSRACPRVHAASLRRLAALPGSDACRSLVGLTEFVVDRRQ